MGFQYSIFVCAGKIPMSGCWTKFNYLEKVNYLKKKAERRYPLIVLKYLLRLKKERSFVRAHNLTTTEILFENVNERKELYVKRVP